MLPKVFVDGHTGTTGLRIRQWLAGHPGVELLTLPPELRRNPEERQARIRESEVAILCLPDLPAVTADQLMSIRWMVYELHRSAVPAASPAYAQLSQVKGLLSAAARELKGC